MTIYTSSITGYADSHSIQVTKESAKREQMRKQLKSVASK